jgi:hypothetical protein
MVPPVSGMDGPKKIKIDRRKKRRWKQETPKLYPRVLRADFSGLRNHANFRRAPRPTNPCVKNKSWKKKG